MHFEPRSALFSGYFNCSACRIGYDCGYFLIRVSNAFVKWPRKIGRIFETRIDFFLLVVQTLRLCRLCQ